MNQKIEFRLQLLDYKEQWDLTIIFVSYLMCTNTTTLRTSKMFALFSEHERTRKCLTSPNLLIPIPSKPYSSYHCYHRHNTSTKWVKNRLGLTGKVIILFPIIPISSSWLLKAHWHQIKSTQKAQVVPEICNVFLLASAGHLTPNTFSFH